MPTPNIIRQDHQVINALGTVLRTFDAEDLARAWARKNCSEFGPLDVVRVTVSEVRERVYRAKPRAERARLEAAERAGIAA